MTNRGNSDLQTAPIRDATTRRRHFVIALLAVALVMVVISFTTSSSIVISRKDTFQDAIVKVEYVHTVRDLMQGMVNVHSYPGRFKLTMGCVELVGVRGSERFYMPIDADRIMCVTQDSPKAPVVMHVISLSSCSVKQATIRDQLLAMVLTTWLGTSEASRHGFIVLQPVGDDSFSLRLSHPESSGDVVWRIDFRTLGIDRESQH